MTDAEYIESLKTNIAQQNELFTTQTSKIDDLSGKLMAQVNSITEIQQLPVLQPVSGSSSNKYILLGAVVLLLYFFFTGTGSCRK